MGRIRRKAMGQQFRHLCRATTPFVKPTLHLFVCTNERPIGGRPACGQRGKELAAALAEAIARDPHLVGRTRVTSCECLGPCFDGPNLVVYPEGLWYSGVAVDDVPELVSALAAGGALERLLSVGDDE